MGGMEPVGGFFEEDEPVDAVVSAFARGEKGMTAPPPVRGRTTFMYLGGIGLASFPAVSKVDPVGVSIRR